MLLKVAAFVFDTGAGKALSALVGVGLLVLSFSVHNANQRSIGAERQEARQERANAKARARADSAARKSVDPAAGGVLNPHYRRD